MMDNEQHAGNTGNNDTHGGIARREHTPQTARHDRRLPSVKHLRISDSVFMIVLAGAKE